MTASGDAPELRVEARDVRIPPHLSAPAQALLAMGVSKGEETPDPGDLDAWRTYAQATDERTLALMQGMVQPADVVQRELDVDGIRVYEAEPPDLTSSDTRVYLNLHGGGFITGRGECCRLMGLHALALSRTRTWSVDYRMPPDHPYPAPLDDCLAVYRSLLRDHRADELVVGGGSAGGGLAAALVLRARDEGLPLPAALVLTTPEVDLTESGDTFRTNLGLDNVLTGSLMNANLLYASGNDLSHPYLSPLFGTFTPDDPPTILTSGTRDLFLSNTVRMHRVLRKAGVQAELHVLEAGAHAGFFGQAPEDHEIDDEIRRFLDVHWPAPTGPQT